MITLICQGCEVELKVPEEKAGKKGKCPKCSARIVVPQHGSDSPIPNQTKLGFKYPELEKLHEYFINESDGPVKVHDNFEEDTLFFSVMIMAGEIGTRSQMVSCKMFGDQGEYLYLIMSSIGKLVESDQAISLLRSCYGMLDHSAFLSDDNIAYISSSRKVRLTDNEEIMDLVYRVGLSADIHEQVFFDWDLQ